MPKSTNDNYLELNWTARIQPLVADSFQPMAGARIDEVFTT